ncbi:hypothetical protein OUZ56_016333 [Daphnia magna]|uniref:Uncharacterized protein n=1 Tax=Daphnia magna TaxID=35525 RepID=A0ABR0AQC1_9CRUS|nr:hypothetical protein OUZ56_016333 [Daphnia magna]
MEKGSDLSVIEKSTIVTMREGGSSYQKKKLSLVVKQSARKNLNCPKTLLDICTVPTKGLEEKVF